MPADAVSGEVPGDGVRSVIVGIDAGTSVVKSVAFDLSGRQVAVASRPNSFARVAGGGAEQDMARTFSETAETLRELMQRLPGGASSVLAVAVTGQGDGTWLIDEAGEPVGPAWLWLDARAGELAAEMIRSEMHPAHYRATGTGINPCQQAVQLLTMKRRTPERVARAATAFHCKDWLYFKLTGVRAGDPSETVFTYGNFRTRTYDDAVIEGLGLDRHRHLMPPIVDGARESHPLSADAARATGLVAGTPIILGYVDFVATAIGGGLIDASGTAGCSILGTTGMHERFVATPDEVILNDEQSGYVALLPHEGAVAQIQSNMAATLNIDWMLDLARGVLKHEGVELDRKDLVGSLDERVLGAEPLSAIYHPYISKRRRARAVHEPACAGAVHRPSLGGRLLRPDADRHGRARLRVARLLLGDGGDPGRNPPDRWRRPLHRHAPDPGERPRPAGADRRAGRGRCGRGGDDRGDPAGRLSRHRRDRRDLGDPAAFGCDRARCGAHRRLRPGLRTLPRSAPDHGAGLGAVARDQGTPSQGLNGRRAGRAGYSRGAAAGRPTFGTLRVRSRRPVSPAMTGKV